MAHQQMFDDDDPLLAQVRALALALPEADEKVSHGRPAFFTKKVFCIYGGSLKIDGEWGGLLPPHRPQARHHCTRRLAPWRAPQRPNPSPGGRSPGIRSSGGGGWSWRRGRDWHRRRPGSATIRRRRSSRRCRCTWRGSARGRAARPRHTRRGPVHAGPSSRRRRHRCTAPRRRTRARRGGPW